MIPRLAPLALIALCACHDDRGPQRASTRVQDVLWAKGDEQGWQRAETVRTLQFPEDYGPHPGFRSEWWYFSGNLTDTKGERFGFQLTFFRAGLRPRAVHRESSWGARELYMAHLAVVRGRDGGREVRERFGRAALGLAGARATPFRVWLEDWSATSSGVPLFPLRLRAADDGVSLDLVLRDEKDLVLQGDRGLSRKSAAPGNASYYYSFTRLAAEGTVELAGARAAVRGSAWLDREWSTSALGTDQVGWDWFALQLPGERELMYYQLRAKDGAADPHSAGVVVGPRGVTRKLAPGDVRLVPQRRWRSPHSGAVYPVEWSLEVPAEALALRVVPVRDDQELRVSFTYWEGAVDATGTWNAAPVQGLGYLEMVGYLPR